MYQSTNLSVSNFPGTRVDAATQNDSTGSTPETATASKGVKVTAGIVVAGVLLTGIVAGGLLGGGLRSGTPADATGSAEMTTVSTADLTGAAGTLSPQSAPALTAEAKACHAPLGWMTLTKSAGTQGGTVRIRSGVYLSPPFTVSDAPQRIAIPFPTAYSVGRGQITVEGAATGVELTLTPTWTAPSLQGVGIINVWWNTSKPCG
jgi:hypothetical protein